MDFKCAEDEKKSETIKEFVKEISYYILDTIGEKKIKSIILTGSTGRGEASAININGEIKILSDFDFMVVTSNIKWSKLRNVCKVLSKDLTNKMKTRGLLSHICITATTPFFLKILKPSIRNNEFKKLDKVVWGEDSLRHVRFFKTEKIPKMDAIELINNRMAEHLENQFQNNELYFSYYLNSKYVIDTARSLLAFENQFKYKYSERPQQINILFKKLNLNIFLPMNYPKFIEIWTKFKLNPDIEEIEKRYIELKNLGKNDDIFQSMCRDTSEILLKVWLYEVTDLLKEKKVEYPESEYIKYLIKKYVNSNTNFLKALIVSTLFFLDNRKEIHNAFYMIKQMKHPKILINASLISLLSYQYTLDKEFLLLSYKFISCFDKKVKKNINWEYLAKKTVEWWGKIESYYVKA